MKKKTLQGGGGGDAETVPFVKGFHPPSIAEKARALGRFPLADKLNGARRKAACCGDDGEFDIKGSRLCLDDVNIRSYYTDSASTSFHSCAAAQAHSSIVWADLPSPLDQDSWLANYNEPGQSVEKYACKALGLFAPKETTIYLMPIVQSYSSSAEMRETSGLPAYSPDLDQLAKWAAVFYDRPVKVLPYSYVYRKSSSCSSNDSSRGPKRTTKKSNNNKSSPSSSQAAVVEDQSFELETPNGAKFDIFGRVSPDKSRQQLHIKGLLHSLAIIRRKGSSSRDYFDADLSNASCLVGVTMADLYSSDTDLFVAGYAGENNSAVFSFARYHPLLKMSFELWYDYGYAKTMPSNPYFEDGVGNRNRTKLDFEPSESHKLTEETRSELFRRTGRLLIHEIGHLHGFEHCIYYHCLMNGAGNLIEDFATPVYLCGVCLRKLQYLQGFDVKLRYARLAEVFLINEMDKEYEWISQRLATLTIGVDVMMDSSVSSTDMDATQVSSSYSILSSSILSSSSSSTLQKRNRSSCIETNRNASNASVPDDADIPTKILKKRSKQIPPTSTPCLLSALGLSLDDFPTLCSDRGPACILAKRTRSRNTTELGFDVFSELLCSLEDWDALVDLLAGLRSCPLTNWNHERSEYMLTLPPPLLQNVSLGRCRADSAIEISKLLFVFVAAELSYRELCSVLYAGFVVFAQASMSSFSGPTLQKMAVERGILSLELGGELIDRSSEDDHGGRIMLTDISQLIVGKKSTKTVCDSDKSHDKCGASSSHPFRLEASFDFDRGLRAWDACVAQHGDDWMGFASSRIPYMDMWQRQQQELQQQESTITESDQVASGPPATVPRLLVISLFDERCGSLIVSEEIGILVGSVYSCISHYTIRSATYSRADKVRSNAATLWLARAGVSAFDVGTTAQYYVDLSGYHRTSRQEFVSEWREKRSIALSITSLRMITAPCRQVKSLLDSHRSKSRISSSLEL